jgi:hypothetical protein
MYTETREATTHPEIIKVSTKHKNYEGEEYEWGHFEDATGKYLYGGGRIEPDDSPEVREQSYNNAFNEALKIYERTTKVRAEFSNFDTIANKYANTKPIRGRTEDARPIAERRYAWKRISKIDDNTYALEDGNGWYSTSLTDEQKLMPYPILWQRKEDGDYITIRNHINDSTSVSRYDFLYRYLPQEMRFHYENGKHYVRYEGVDHYLPKSKTEFDYNTKTVKVYQDSKIVFKHVDGKFIRANEPQPFRTRRVDKELEKTLKPKIKEYWDWMNIVLPVLGETIHANRTQYGENMGVSVYWWTRNIQPKRVLDIIENPEHEHRMNFAVMIASEIGAINNDIDNAYRFNPHSDSFSKMLKLLRRVGNLYATELK